jgi:hypothetical protein
VVLGPSLDQGSWVRLGRPFALVLAALSALVLWVLYAMVWRCGAPRDRRALLLSGMLCPVVVTTSVFQISGLVRGAHERRTAQQLARSRVSDIRDEPLLGAQGHPIGVRIHYSVAYAEGLDDPRYAPFATVHVDEPMQNLQPRGHSASPAVRGGYGKTEYRFTGDYVPSFLPGALVFPESRDWCMRWPSASAREALLGSPPQRYRILVEPYRSARETTGQYALRTFYQGALEEGAKECS